MPVARVRYTKIHQQHRKGYCERGLTAPKEENAKTSRRCGPATRSLAPLAMHVHAKHHCCSHTKVKFSAAQRAAAGRHVANTLTVQLQRCVPNSNSNQGSCKEELVPEHEERIATLTLELPYTSSMCWGKIRCHGGDSKKDGRDRDVVPKHMSSSTHRLIRPNVSGPQGQIQSRAAQHG